LCAFGAPGNTPGNTPDSEEACDMIEDGVRELIRNPGALLHAEEWKNGEYNKFLGLWTFDLATLAIPKIGKAAAGIKILEDALPAGLAKLLSGELLHGIKNFGSESMDAALKKLGAIKLSKLLEIDVDVPSRLTFKPIEINLLKITIDTRGLPDVEKLIRDLPSGSKIIEELEKLLKICTRDSFAPETRVVLANGTRKAIRDIRVGDAVLATDPLTGATSGETVTQLHRNLDTELADVTVAAAGGGRGTLRTTRHHPFWNATTRQWTGAGDLRSGTSLLSAGRRGVTVKDVKRYGGARWMYNLTVADLHTYYVVAGRTPVLVHNCNGFDPVTGGLDDVTYDAIEKAFSLKVAEGVNHNVERMHDGSVNSADHEIPGIGHDPMKLAQYLSGWVGKGTHKDVLTGSTVVLDPVKSVLIVERVDRIHAYKYTQAHFDNAKTSNGNPRYQRLVP
jgi:hypothetical protein